jgi:carbamoyltransferase
MRVIGIHDGHTASVCSIEDGTVAYAASEERFNRRKSCGGPPRLALKDLVRAGFAARPDVIAVSGIIQPSVAIDEVSLRRALFFSLARIIPGSLLSSRALVKAYVEIFRRFRDQDSIRAILEESGLGGAEHKLVEHHHAHAAGAYFLSPFHARGEKALVITLDGSGDGLCGTVSVGAGGKLDRLYSMASYDSIGQIYTRTTQYLGMKPWEHEYKVMGLAPYASDADSRKAHAVFERYIGLSADGKSFVNRSSFGPALFGMLYRDLKGIRFDHVAAGLQKRFEETVLGFVKAWVAESGLKKVALGGGCFMNVKCNMLINELPELEEVFFLPSCGDESTCLGAAAAVAVEMGGTVKPLADLYIGPSYEDAEIEECLEKHRAVVKWKHLEDIEAETARLIVANKIVGRLKHRMEWGARALGNRTIISNPLDVRNNTRLNKAIKMRDFWMPFAPTIIAQRAHDYITSSKPLKSPHMMLAFQTTVRGRSDLVAALHPFDMTCRPQILDEGSNPDYHRLISDFEVVTGVGGVLNTSFNLHGEPIVNSPEDAIHTLLNSGLDYVTIENFLVSRR